MRALGSSESIKDFLRLSCGCVSEAGPAEQIELGIRLNAAKGVASRFLLDNCISHSARTNFERNKNPEENRENRRNNSVESTVALSYDAALRTQSVYFLSLVYSSRHKKKTLTYLHMIITCMYDKAGNVL